MTPADRIAQIRARLDEVVEKSARLRCAKFGVVTSLDVDEVVAGTVAFPVLDIEFLLAHIAKLESVAEAAREVVGAQSVRTRAYEVFGLEEALRALDEEP